MDNNNLVKVKITDKIYIKYLQMSKGKPTDNGIKIDIDGFTDNRNATFTFGGFEQC